MYATEWWEINVPESNRIYMMTLTGGEIESADIFVKDGMSGFARRMKRICDFILALFLLVLTFPLFIVVFIAIKITDGGSVFYTQWRVGRLGKPFKIYKFRSMCEKAEDSEPQLSCSSESDGDERIFKVGAFLRAHHLDELPQIWNVLIGDMSFVGYRPERQFFISQILEYDKRYECLYQSRPGVTSYATLYNGYTDTMEKMLRRLEYDLYYLEHRTWWLDIKILWLTFWGIISGKKL